MNNFRGIPPLPNWGIENMSIIIDDNLLYLSNNYIVNIDLNSKEFLQLIHSSNNIYFDNKFILITKINASFSDFGKDVYFACLDSYGNLCFFSKVNNNMDIEKENENIYPRNIFKEERFTLKIGNRNMNYKAIINISIKNNTDLNSFEYLVIADKNGYLNIYQYFFNEKKEIEFKKNNFIPKKITKGYATLLRYIK